MIETIGKTLLENITSILTLLGIIVTFYVTKYSCKKEIEKLRTEKMTEKIENIPYEILTIMYKIQKLMDKPQEQKKLTDDFVDIVHRILSYGSLDAVKISSFIQQESYKNELGSFKLLAAYSLLVTQLKYDLIHEVVPPDFYFKLKITDYENVKCNIAQDINSIVKELKLKKEFSVIEK